MLLMFNFILKFLKRIALVLVILGLLALNATMLFWEAGAKIVSGFLLASTGIQTVLGGAIQELDNSKKKLDIMTKDLEAEKSRAKNLKRERTKNADKVKKIKRRVAEVATKMATINVVAVPLEFIPIAGAGIAAGVTAWELKQSCDMLKALKELDQIYGYSDEAGKSEEETTVVCGMKAPTFAEAWNMGREGFLENYEKLVEVGVENLPDWDDVIPDWDNIWKKLKESFKF